MTKKMLIDASHPEETRVVVVNGTRVEELDFESRNKRQLRGNVYLARVTRVEPSLQAAFVEYGGNRHGFLAFSEIHPDYYQIPYEDRMALIEAEEAENAQEDEAEEEEQSNAVLSDTGEALDDDDVEIDDAEIDHTDDSDEDEHIDPNEDLTEDATDDTDEEVASEQVKTAKVRRKQINRRRYKIQEVIKRGQILLIQAVKEERGNKGAAMTTYLSLAGRYCVLMPNTPRGGGISRKISNGADRKHLKAIVKDLDVPSGIGVIVRTAGAKKTKTEIKRDYDYLTRLWGTIRETTLKSSAPALIHEEGNLVKRSIRDMYNKDINEILVQGDQAYKSAKAFIKMLMPSHAKNVKHYQDTVPLFLRYEVEKQIENSLQSIVQLKSGGYLVIHPTEALVSVDVNSGRSTKERNVERTALKTNLEAAEELARQMRLRDLAGLIVIDFIDMDENRNNRAVEKRMRDVLLEDRARVQYSRISQFGLMEISRQRRRRSLLEGSTASCEHCDGVGRKRTIESSALAAIRAVEEIGVRGQAKRVKLKVSPDVALYIFNEKRDLLTNVDQEFDLFTELSGDDALIRPSFSIEIVEKVKNNDDPLEVIEKENKKLNQEAQKQSRKKKPSRTENDKDEKSDSENTIETEDTDEDGNRRRKRRRGRRGGRSKRRDEEQTNVSDTESPEEAAEHKVKDDEAEKPKRRRGRRKAASSKTEHAEPSETDEAPKTGRRRAAPKRKAPSKTEAPKATSDATAEPEVSETQTKSKLPTRKGVRAAPPRKPKSKDEAKPKAKRTRKTTTKTAPKKEAAVEVAENAPSETSRRRAAPSRKAPAKTSAKKAAPKKTPAKKSVKASTETKASTSAKKPASKKIATKKAPARNKATAKTEDVKLEPKAKRVKKAPAKKATSKAAPSKPSEAPKAKQNTRKKAAKKPTKAEAETAQPPTKKRAPIKAEQPKPDSEDAPAKTKVAPRRAAASNADKDDKKKGGWLSRILK